MQAGFSAVLVLLVLLFSFSISAAYPPRSIIQMALGTCNIPSLPEKMESHLNRSLLKSLKHWSGTDKEKEAKTWKMIVDMKELASEQIRGKEDSASLNTYRKNVNAMCDSVIKHLSKSAGGSKMDEENLKIHSIIEEHALQIQHNKELFANIVDHHHKLIEKVSTGGQSWENAISSDSASLSRYADAAKEMGEKAWVQQGQRWMEDYAIDFFFAEGAKKGFVKSMRARHRDLNSGEPIPAEELKGLNEMCSQPLNRAPDRINVLDIGSCYNPHKEQPLFEVLALDLQPTDPSVYTCDFLELGLLNSCSLIESAPVKADLADQANPDNQGNQNENTEMEDLSKRRLLALPQHRYDVIMISLVLCYLPDSERRIAMLQKARRLLVSPPTAGDATDTDTSPSTAAASGTADVSKSTAIATATDATSATNTSAASPHKAGIMIILEKESIFSSKHPDLHLKCWKREIANCGFELLTYQFMPVGQRKVHLFAFRAVNNVNECIPRPLIIRSDFDDCGTREAREEALEKHLSFYSGVDVSSNRKRKREKVKKEEIE